MSSNWLFFRDHALPQTSWDRDAWVKNAFHARSKSFSAVVATEQHRPSVADFAAPTTSGRNHASHVPAVSVTSQRERVGVARIYLVQDAPFALCDGSYEGLHVAQLLERGVASLENIV
jgi:hypothetical protein